MKSPRSIRPTPMLGSKLPSHSAPHTGIGPTLRPTYLLVRSTTRIFTPTFTSSPQTAQRTSLTRSSLIRSSARLTGRSLSTLQPSGILVLPRTLLQVSQLSKRESSLIQSVMEPCTNGMCRDVGSQATKGTLKRECWKTLNWTTTWAQFSNQGVTKGQSTSGLLAPFIVFSQR